MCSLSKVPFSKLFRNDVSYYAERLVVRTTATDYLSAPMKNSIEQLYRLYQAIKGTNFMGGRFMGMLEVSCKFSLGQKVGDCNDGKVLNGMFP